MGALLFFKKLLKTKKFLSGEDIKIFSHRVTCFPVDTFKSHSTEIFVGEPFNVSEESGYRKTFFIMGRYPDFLSNYLSLAVPKNFVGEPLGVSEIVWYGKKLRIS